MRVEKFTQLKNIDRLSKIIFMNFIELQNQPDIEFSVKDISSTLANESIVGWFLLDNDDRIVGYLIGNTKDIGDGRVVYYISYFYIIQKYRNYGIGTKMLIIALKHATQNNLKFVMLISRIDSKAWNMYKKYGFIEDPLIKLSNNKDYKVLLYYCS
jgi:ribosomal protein S18 acetylase RimI-like enzyme